MNDILSDDTIHHMLRFTEIARWSGPDEFSLLGFLRTCPRCYRKSNCETEEISCRHLHDDELEGIKNLMLVCNQWKDIIENYFNFSDMSVGIYI